MVVKIAFKDPELIQPIIICFIGLPSLYEE
jgi:hypothetical protein